MSAESDLQNQTEYLKPADQGRSALEYGLLLLPPCVQRSDQTEAGQEQGQPEQGAEREQSPSRNKDRVHLGRNIRCVAGNVGEVDW